MRNLRFVVFAVVGMFLFAGLAQAQSMSPKIAYLDLTKLFDNYNKTKESDAVLEKEYKAYEEERNAKVEKIQEIQGKLALLKEEEKEKLLQEMETMKNDLLEYDQAKRTDLSKRRDEKVREILLEIEKTVSDFAKKEKYDFIFNDRVLIYGAETLDVTDQVLPILNGETK